MARGMLALLTALLLVASLPLSALAAEWYLEDGDITVNANESGQTVSQGSNTDVRDDNPTITQKDSSASTGNTITIKTEDNATANVTIEDVNISTDRKHGIEVGDSSLNLTVKGENTIKSTNNILAAESAPSAGIHVSSGSLTITGDGTLEVEAGGFRNCSAAIGSKYKEDMSGSITIGGEATVTGTGGRGAGIGSGSNSKLTGTITIKDNATVNATGGVAAAIGSGVYGEMSGTITIGGEATVTSTGDRGAGIGSGSGEYGEMSGTISISTKATVDASSNAGEDIGAGADGTNTGTIRYFDPAPTQPEPAKTPLYRVLNERGEPLSCTKELADGVLTITVDADFAKLIGTVLSLKTLENQGVTSITLVTKNATSTFSLADLQAKGTGTYTLTHDTETVTFTLAKADVSDILK